MTKTLAKQRARAKRHQRVRQKVFGTAERPRLCIFRSNRYLYVQIIDDVNGNTLVSANTQPTSSESSKITGKNIKAASFLGQSLAQKALQKNIKQVVFDRGGYRYHGRIAALAEAARKEGLDF